MLRVYTLKNCPNCEELKNIFKQRNVSYEELNVEDDFIARAKLIENDLEDLPVLEIGGKLKSGPVKELLQYVV